MYMEVLLSRYNNHVVMSSSEGEHYETTLLTSSSEHYKSNNKESESEMLQPVAQQSSDNNEIVNSEKMKEASANDNSQQKLDKLADGVWTGELPNEITSTHELVPIKEDELTTNILNHQSSMTSEGGTGTSTSNEVVLTFPQRLMEMLDDPRNIDMMAWLPHGRAFAIYRKREFAADVLPKYFQKAAKYSSFTRKLNRWGFIRVTRGPETGAYYHRLFRRGEHRLVLQMTCHTTTPANTNAANTSSGSSTSKQIDGTSHASAENDTMAMMMMYPNQVDPASQYMYHQYPFGGPHQQHSSSYPHMGQQHYYGNISPYNMYDAPPTDGGIIPPSLSDDGQYYPSYSNHYGMPQTHGQYSDQYPQGPYHENNTANLPPYHDDNVERSHLMSDIAERAESSSVAATTGIEEVRSRQYSNDEGKSNYRKRSKSTSSFRPTGRYDYDYNRQHAPAGYGNNDAAMMMYNSTSSQYHPTYEMNAASNVGDRRGIPTGYTDDESMRQPPPKPQEELDMMTQHHHQQQHQRRNSNIVTNDNPLFSPAGRQASSHGPLTRDYSSTNDGGKYD